MISVTSRTLRRAAFRASAPAPLIFQMTRARTLSRECQPRLPVDSPIDSTSEPVPRRSRPGRAQDPDLRRAHRLQQSRRGERLGPGSRPRDVRATSSTRLTQPRQTQRRSRCRIAVHARTTLDHGIADRGAGTCTLRGVTIPRRRPDRRRLAMDPPVKREWEVPTGPSFVEPSPAPNGPAPVRPRSNAPPEVAPGHEVEEAKRSKGPVRGFLARLIPSRGAWTGTTHDAEFEVAARKAYETALKNQNGASLAPAPRSARSAGARTPEPSAA